MSAMTNLLVKDDAGTPNEFTFVPVTDTPQAYWRAQTASVPLEGQLRLTAFAEKQKNQGYKITAKLEVPVMETLGASGTSAGYVAPPKVAYTNTMIMTMFCDRRSTAADRANTLRLAVGLLQGASATSGTGTLANTAAGGAFGASIAPLPQLYCNVVVPN